jgi:hypothetical protein
MRAQFNTAASDGANRYAPRHVIEEGKPVKIRR